MNSQERSYIFKSRAGYLIVLSAVVATTSCGDTDRIPEHSHICSAPPEPIVQITTPERIVRPKSLRQRLVTEFGGGKHEAWVCFDQIGEPTLYTFYDKGRIENFEGIRLGSEYSVRPEVAPFHYAWRIRDQYSIKIESPPLGLQDFWFSIEFSDDTDSDRRLMKVTSLAKGKLYCSLEGRQS